MSDNNQTAGGDQPQYKVSFEEGTAQSGKYANVASVHVNKNEVVVDFGYLLPNSKEPTIAINSRVNLSHETAKSFMSMMQNAMLDFQNKMKNAE